jgi:hypothetical protein
MRSAEHGGILNIAKGFQAFLYLIKTLLTSFSAGCPRIIRLIFRALWVYYLSPV